MIPKFAIEGGPCGGKSSSMTFLAEKLRGEGYYPILVPEAATILITAGITPVGGVISLPVFQECVIDLMLTLEATAERAAIASGHPKPVILCDRGIMGSRGYVSDDVFFAIAKDKGLNMSTMCDARYTGIFHLRSAAFDAEHAYTRANNSARSETPEDARKKDERTLRAWVGHPRVHVIHNRVPSFDAKLDMLWQRMQLALGMSSQIRIRRKFLVEALDISCVAVPQQKVIIMQAYTKEKGVRGYLRIRRREHLGHPTFYAARTKVIRGVYREDEWLIDSDIYEKFLTRAIKGTRELTKVRHCFVYHDQYFELDVFGGVHLGLHLLSVELPNGSMPIEFPPFVRVIREVSNDPAYKNSTLAKS